MRFEILKTLFYFMKPADYTYYTYFFIFKRLKDWIVFYLGQSKTPFFINGIIQFGPKAGLAPVAQTIRLWLDFVL